jgi:hypothetical protein
LQELIDRLINDVANPALAEIDARALPGVINAKDADKINIWVGKEDLEGYAGQLFGILDAIPDNQEREAAFWVLYHVVNGTLHIAKSGIYPLNEAQHSADFQAAKMRAGRPRNTAERNRMRQSVIDEIEKKVDKLPPVKKLLSLVNAQLKKKTISGATLRRLLENRHHS